MNHATIDVIDLSLSTSESETDTNQKQENTITSRKSKDIASIKVCNISKVLPADIMLSSDDDDEVPHSISPLASVNSNIRKEKEGSSKAASLQKLQQHQPQPENLDKSSKIQKPMAPLLASVHASFHMRQFTQANNRGRQENPSVPVLITPTILTEIPSAKTSNRSFISKDSFISPCDIAESEKSKENITKMARSQNTFNKSLVSDEVMSSNPNPPLPPSVNKKRSSNHISPSLLQSQLPFQQQQHRPSSSSQSNMLPVTNVHTNKKLRQCFSLPPEARLQLPILDLSSSRIISAEASTSITFLQQQAVKTLSHLRKEEWQRSRRLIAENYQRALGNWQAEFSARLHEDILYTQIMATKSTQHSLLPPVEQVETASIPAENDGEKEKETIVTNVSTLPAITIQRVKEPARLTVVGTFQPHKSDPRYRQTIPFHRALYNISAKVYAVHVISKSSVSMLGRKISTIPFYRADSKTAAMLEEGYRRSQSNILSHTLTCGTLTSSSTTSSSITPELSIKLTESPTIFNLVIPLCDTIPFAWTWIPIPGNVHKDDEVELRAMPYFGDDDTDGIDISEFKKVPGKLEKELRGEAEELTVMLLLDRYQRSKAIFTALEIVLGVSIPEISNTLGMITEGRWFREVIIPMLAKIDDSRKIQNMDKHLAFSMYSNDVKKDRLLLEECGNDLALWTLHGPDIPVFNVDSEINRSLGIGVGLGIQNSHGFECIISNYRTLFCRRCFTYGCQEHSTQHPMPIVRRDPLPPLPCPINHLTLPTDSVRAYLRSTTVNNLPKSTVATVSLEAFQHAQKTNNIPALRISLMEMLIHQQQHSVNQQLTPLILRGASHKNTTTNSNSCPNNNLSAINSPSRTGSSIRSKRSAGSVCSSPCLDPSPKKARRDTVIDLLDEGKKRNHNPFPEKAFVDSLFVSSDRSIHWVHYIQHNNIKHRKQSIRSPDKLNSGPVLRDWSIKIDKVGNERCKMDSVPWVKHGVSLLAREIAAYRAGQEELRQQPQSNQLLLESTLENNTTQPSTGLNMSPTTASESNSSHNIPYPTNAQPTNPQIPTIITPYKSSFPPAHVVNYSLDTTSVWKSKLGTPVLHIQGRFPELEMIPHEVIMDVDDIDELEGDLRLFQESEAFTPALTDAELSMVYKALLMFHNSPPKSIMYQYNDDEHESGQSEGHEKKNNDYTLQDLIQFVCRIVGTRTKEEIQKIVVRKRIIVALRSRYEKVREKKDQHVPGAAISQTEDELHEIDGISSILSDVLSLLPPIRMKNEPKSSNRPPMVKNSFDCFYEPCHHEGSCTVANGCSCAEKNIFCEKYCACGPSCRIKVIGCKCKSGCRFKSCPCLAASRACDPDLCGVCGASIHPMFRMDVCSFIQQGLHQVTVNEVASSSTTSITATTANHQGVSNGSSQILCENLPFSYRRKPPVYVGRSEIHGWGAYAGRRIEKGEYITEYTGELISQDEAERRGLIYDKHKSSYIFESNMFECIDATRKGNRARFLNHVGNEEATVGPKIMKINGDHRIGMFAKTTIEAGQELTFNYGYSGQTAPKWSHNSRTENEGTNGSIVNMKSTDQKIVNGGDPSSTQAQKLQASRKKKK